jgi:hypothetical protein
MSDLIYKGSGFVTVDDGKHETYSVMTSEAQDSEGERCHYETQKPLTQKWSKATFDATSKSGQASPSHGNMRWQHRADEIAGKITAIEYDDEKKQIRIKTQPTPEKWPLIRDSFATGVSHAGTYARRWCPKCNQDIPQGNKCKSCGPVSPFYALKPVECSYCDYPANPDARFLFVKADGSRELRKFASQAADISLHQKGDMTTIERYRKRVMDSFTMAEMHRLPDVAAVIPNAASKADYYEGEAQKWKARLEDEIRKSRVISFPETEDWLIRLMGPSKQEILAQELREKGDDLGF